MPVLTRPDAEIHYEVHGEHGPCVAFAHGRGGNGASWWQQVPRFARDHRVIVFDHRGFGRSRCAPGAFDRARFSDDLLAILDAEGIERAAIVCQSMGGWTGLRTAVVHPERVCCLVLSNTPGGIDTDSVSHALAGAREQFARLGVARAAVAPDFAERAPERAWLYAQISSFNVNLPENLYAAGDRISTGQLAALETPTLFITSEHDAIFAPSLIRELAAHVPGARCVELAGAGHSPYFETPDAFNDEVASFLAAHGC